MSCQNQQRYYPVLGDTRVLGWCDLNPKKLQWELIAEEADTGYLGDEGFTGW